MRKSRADLELEARGEMETLVRHEKLLLELARKNHIQITKIYKEIVSADTIDARPVMQQLLEEVERGAWEGVFVTEIERLARGDTIDQGIVARAFKINNTKIITPLKTYDPENEFDEEYFEFGLFMSRREYKTINRRIQRGRVQSAKDGKFLSSVAPYGYEKVKIKNDKGFTLEICKREAQTVKYIFQQYISGDGMSVIAAQLDSMGVKPRNRDTWSRSTISDILSNPVYTGKIRWSYRKEKKASCGDGPHKTRTVNEDCILVDGLHRAIISDALYQQAQEVRRQNRKSCVKKTFLLQNPLSGLIYCKKCGSLMTRLGQTKNNKHEFLYCKNRYCDNIAAPLFLAEEVLIQELQKWLDDYKVEISKQLECQQKEDIQATSLHAMQREAADLEKQIARTYDLLEKNIYTTEVFLQRNQVLAEKKERLLNAIEELKAKTASTMSAREILDNFIPLAQSILDRYFTVSDPQERNRMLKTLLRRVDYIKKQANTRGQLHNVNFSLYIYPNIPNT